MVKTFQDEFYKPHRDAGFTSSLDIYGDNPSQSLEDRVILMPNSRSTNVFPDFDDPIQEN